MRIPCGETPTGTVATTRRASVSTTLTVPSPPLVTYAKRPSGVSTTWAGCRPTRIRAATLSVAVSMAQSSPGFPIASCSRFGIPLCSCSHCFGSSPLFVTQASFPSGETWTLWGPRPAGTTADRLSVPASSTDTVLASSSAT